MFKVKESVKIPLFDIISKKIEEKNITFNISHEFTYIKKVFLLFDCNK